MGDAAYIFYGSSGEKLTRDPPPDDKLFEADVQSFSNADSNKSYQRAAETLGATIKRTWPSWNVVVQATWTHAALINALVNSKDAIHQVHIFSHGASSGLSLSYKFPNVTGKRLNAQGAAYWGDLPLYTSEACIDRALAREDALVAGRLSRYGREHNARLRSQAGTMAAQVAATATIVAIRGILAEGAYFHLWNCYSGTALADYHIGHPYHALAIAYRERMQQLMTEQAGAGAAGDAKPGIAREIAKVFGVHCTAAKRIDENREAGTLFFHRDGKGAIQVQANKEPSWMWIHPNAYWLTYGPDGNLANTKNQVLMFGKWRDAKDVPSAAVSGNDPKKWTVKTPPPKWFTDAYDKTTL